MPWIIVAVCSTLIFTIYKIIARFAPETEFVNMVCITNNHKKPSLSTSEGTWYAGERAYYLPSRFCYREQKDITVYVDDPPYFSWRWLASFYLQYKPLAELPEHYKVIENETAYFLGNAGHPSPENFYHYTKQIYFPLYWLIKQTGRLHEGVSNIVFYPFVYAICHSGQYWYHDIFRYEIFKKILRVETHPEHSLFTDKQEPDGMCYKNAVFSSDMFLDKATEAVDYFKSALNVTDDSCEPNTENLVILDRTRNRRIVNIEALKKVGESLGYNTKVVIMEHLSWKEQTQIIHCAKILAGVTGAGLQWSFFMKDNSGVVEIAWPHQDWPLFFAGQTGKS